MLLKLYNTYYKTNQEINKAVKLKIYCCGPTVYNYAHIGNFRTYIFEDILVKTLKILSYNFEHTMNITDIGHLTEESGEAEDKILKSARERGLSVFQIADFFREAFFSDASHLNIQRPNKVLKASEHIDLMIDIIKSLEEKGFTYKKNGNVYFDTSKEHSYGTMANLDKIDLSYSRVEVDSAKKNLRDFVLWFTNSKYKDQAVKWNSPWGEGYPSWHIECVALNFYAFGDSLDIHCGGIDHINVHHTNELAIARAFNNNAWCKFWVHSEFLILDKQKMSKSSENFITIETLKEKAYSPLDYRYLCLTAHYKSQLNFSFEALEASKRARERLKDRLSTLYREAGSLDFETQDLSILAEDYKKKFLSSLANNLETPKALSLLWELLKDKNLLASEKLALSFYFDEVFSLSFKEELKALERVYKFELDFKIQDLINERDKARREKNYKRSDEIRAYLESLNYNVIDTKEGTKVTLKDLK